MRTARHHLVHREALEAVAYRPRHHAWYAGADVLTQAAVLAEGLCRDHCFIDGNKRTAWQATATFLLVRTGKMVTAPPHVRAEWMLRLTIGDRDADAFAGWLRTHLG